MDRSTLEKIFDRAPGVEKTDDGYSINDDHRASMYLGARGSATVLSDLSRIVLHDDLIEAHSKESTHFVTYEPVMGVSFRRPREEVSRTGF